MSSASLLDDQLRIIPAASTIVDVGAHHGATTREYLNAYPHARVFAFEPDVDNHARATENLAAYGDRVMLLRRGVSDRTGSATLHVNSHDGTHSLLPIGEQRYWAAPAHHLREDIIETVTLDGFAADQRIERIDILKLDIQGGELRALRGAETLLSERRIQLIASEVEFHYLYRDQPLIWDIAAYLHRFGFGMYRLYDCYYHDKNPLFLSWADAIFLGPEFLQVSEWGRAPSTTPAT